MLTRADLQVCRELCYTEGLLSEGSREKGCTVEYLRERSGRED